MPLVFPIRGFCIIGGADPQVGVPSGPGRPRPALAEENQALATIEKPARGPAADLGVRPTKKRVALGLGLPHSN